MTSNDDLINFLKEGFTDMSGLILFRVAIPWAAQGRSGDHTVIVQARDGSEAPTRAWAVEDNRDIRTVSVEWLCPVESVQRWNDYHCRTCDETGDALEDGQCTKCREATTKGIENGT